MRQVSIFRRKYHPELLGCERAFLHKDELLQQTKSSTLTPIHYPLIVEMLHISTNPTFPGQWWCIIKLFPTQKTVKTV